MKSDNDPAWSSSPAGVTVSAVKSLEDGQTLYQFVGHFVAPEPGNDSREASRNQVGNADPASTPMMFLPHLIPAMAAMVKVAGAAKTIKDVTHDGWIALRRSESLQVDVLDTSTNINGHTVELKLTNVERSGIFVESISIAASLSEEDQLSLRQTTVRLIFPERWSSMGEQPPREPLSYPILIHATDFTYMTMELSPRLFEVKGDHKMPRSYGVAQLTFSQLDHPNSDDLTFAFRLSPLSI